MKQIGKLYGAKLKKKAPKKTTVVVAKGPNKGQKSRPGGVTGKYKMVDARLRKDTRGLKRAEKRNKKTRK